MNGARVAVVVPLTAGRDPDRMRALAHVERLFAECFPAWPFHLRAGRSAAANRNLGAADAGSVTVLLFCDGDSLVPPEQIEEGVRLAADADGAVSCFDVYARLSQEATGRVRHWRQAFEEVTVWERYRSLSAGCVAVSRRLYDEVGGFDESFGDGFEDLDFANRCGLVAPHRFVHGELVHLWHPRPDPEWEAREPARSRYLARWGGGP